MCGTYVKVRYRSGKNLWIKHDGTVNHQSPHKKAFSSYIPPNTWLVWNAGWQYSTSVDIALTIFSIESCSILTGYSSDIVDTRSSLKYSKKFNNFTGPAQLKKKILIMIRPLFELKKKIYLYFRKVGIKFDLINQWCGSAYHIRIHKIWWMRIPDSGQ